MPLRSGIPSIGLGFRSGRSCVASSINVITVGPAGIKSYQAPEERLRFHVSAGVEFGWWPGLTLTVAYGAWRGLFLLALAGG